MRHFLRLLWKWTAYSLAVLIILLALGIGLFRIIVPQAPAYRAQVEQIAEELIGFPVTIESLSLEWDWFGPELILRDVRLLGPKAKTVLFRADEVQVVINLVDLLEKPIQPARVTLVHPVAELARGEQGNLMLSGIVLGGTDDERALSDWRNTLATVLTYTTTRIEQGEIYWRTSGQWQAAGIPKRWRFSPVNLLLESDGNSYTLEGDVGLPASFGDQLRLQVSATGPANQPGKWAWQGEVQGDKLQAQLIYWLLDVRDKQLAGNLSLMLEGEGVGLQPGLLHGSIRIEDLAQRDGASAAESAVAAETFETIQTGFTWEVSPAANDMDNSASEPPLQPWPAHWALTLQGLAVQRGDQTWPASRWHITRTRLGQDAYRWRAEMGFVRLQDLRQLLAWLPLEVFPGQEKLVVLWPQGDIHNLELQLQRKVDQQQATINHYAAEGTFENLGWSPLEEGFPRFGLQGLDGHIALTSSGGRLQLTSKSVEAKFPGLFRQPLGVRFLNGTLYWQHQLEGWLLHVPDITLGNADIEQIDTKLRAWLPDNKQQSPTLALTADYRNIDFANKSLYLPVGIMSDKLVNWLDASVVSGASPAGKLVMRGALRSFPWRNNEGGLFQISSQLQNTVLEFDPQWPRLESIDGRMLFEGMRFHAWAENATTAGIVVEEAQAGMQDMAAGLLTAQGKAELPIEKGMDYLRVTPIAEKFNAYFEHVALQGEANASIDLKLPLSHLSDAKVNVVADVQHTLAKVSGVPEPFKSIKGQLVFTEKGLASPGFDGQWLGQPFTGTIKQQAGTHIYVSGGSSVADLAKTFGWPLAQLEGAAAWQAELAVQADAQIPVLLQVTSPLKGVAVNLPQPFGKSKDSVSPLRAGLAIFGDQRMRLDLYYAGAAARLAGNTADDGWQPQAGMLVLGQDDFDFNKQETVSLPPDGIAVSGSVERLKLGEWLSVIEPANNEQPAPSTTIRMKPPDWLHSVDLEIGLLEAFAQNIPDLHLTYQRQADAAIVQLQSQPLAGTVTLPLKENLPLNIDLQRAWLSLPNGEASADKKQVANDPLTPSQFPALNISVQDLRIGEAKVGALAASLRVAENGLALEKLTIEGPEYSATADGLWRQTEKSERTLLNVDIHSTGVEDTLQALGFAAGVSADSGTIKGQLSWPGSPFSDILDLLDGKLHLRLEDGALHEVEPGAGRLFGLLSLSALPRRLILDFSDLFSEGLSFDTITGDFILVNGNAYTSNLQLDAPAADILVVGRIGLGAQDFDQLAIVDAHVSSALPVVGALAAGPQAAAVMLLLTQLLNEPLEKASRRKYRITGPWQDPLVEQVVSEEPKKTP